MRIVGGELRGRKLASFEHSSIRPTADRVRESIFNILAPCFPTGDVLDLFAGTGAMGIEALSRGAKRAVFVDSEPAAITAIKKNIEHFKITGRSTVIKNDAMSALKFLSGKGATFDIIFIDPPYAAGVGEAGLYKKTLRFIDESEMLKHGGFVMVETSKRATLDLALSTLVKIDERKYGDTAIHIYRSPEE